MLMYVFPTGPCCFDVSLVFVCTLVLPLSLFFGDDRGLW